jgi:hypothetical protein
MCRCILYIFNALFDAFKVFRAYLAVKLNE